MDDKKALSRIRRPQSDIEKLRVPFRFAEETILWQ